jgi:signal transduction histidine kinase
MSITPKTYAGDDATASAGQVDDILPPPQLLFPDAHGMTIWLSMLVRFGVCVVVGVLFALQAPRDRAGAIGGAETLFALSLVALAVLELTANRRLVLLAAGAAVILGGLLCLTFASELGNVALWFLTFVVVYRLPWRRSLPVLAVDALVFGVTGAVRSFLLLHLRSPSALLSVGGGLALLALLVWIALQQRIRYALILRLQASQAQLRAQMAHAEDLAAARERARIARDMHDVLAHSLTVLSIQAQATREVVTANPERAAAMLDDIAGILRESIAESRRLVGLLREAERTGSRDSPLGARLLALADRFSERTGVRCSLSESGEPRLLAKDQESALQFALQEALTNAYRHGAAQHVWAEVAWQPDAVILSVCDDGTGSATGMRTETEQTVVEAEPSGGGNGLRGMRERAGALGGTVTAGPRLEGGFVVSMTLPLAVVEAALPRGDA